MHGAVEVQRSIVPREGQEWSGVVMIFTRIIAVLLLVAAFHPPAHAQSLKLVSLLFPEAANWPRLDALPPVKPSEMNGFLAQALWADIDQQNMPTVAGGAPSNAGDVEISLFFGANGPLGFYHFPRSSQYGGGIIYSGGSPCCDGDVTIFWPDISDFARMPPARTFPGLIVKIEDSPDPLIVDYESSDGWAPETYSLVSSKEFSRRNSWNVDRNLTLPDGIKPVHKATTFSITLTLRSAPVVNDAYDPGRSHFLQVAAFGNIERRYLPGAEATIIGTWADKTGKQWDLLTVKDQDNSYLATYASLDVEVGWAAEP